MMHRILSLLFLSLSVPFAQGQLLISSQTQQWVDSSWADYLRTAYTYYPDNKEAFHVTEGFLAGSWDNNSKTAYTYDSEGRILTITDYSWDAGEAEWNNPIVRTNEYNGEGLLAGITTTVWMSGSFQNLSKLVLTYDLSTHLLTTQQLDLWNSVTMDWTHQGRWAFVNNTEGLPEEVTYCSWDTQLSWIPEKRYTYAYASFDAMQLNFEERWIDNEWQNKRIQHFTYDGSELLTNLLTEDWDYQGEDWANTLSNTYTYNTDETAYQLLSQDWADTAWVNHLLTTNYYGTAYLGTGEQEPLSPEIYPNPATDQLNIAFGKVTTARVQIMDLNGKTVQTADLSGTEQTVSIAGLPAGVYLVNVISNREMTVKRIVKK